MARWSAFLRRDSEPAGSIICDRTSAGACEYVKARNPVGSRHVPATGETVLLGDNV